MLITAATFALCQSKRSRCQYGELIPVTSVRVTLSPSLGTQKDKSGMFCVISSLSANVLEWLPHFTANRNEAVPKSDGIMF